jgi:hypothetical protein
MTTPLLDVPPPSPHIACVQLNGHQVLAMGLLGHGLMSGAPLSAERRADIALRTAQVHASNEGHSGLQRFLIRSPSVSRVDAP